MIKNVLIGGLITQCVLILDSMPYIAQLHPLIDSKTLSIELCN